MAVRSACAAPARTGTVTCAMLHGRRAGRCFMHWRFPSCLVWRWGTQNSPAPPRRGMRVRIRLPPAWSLVRTCGGDARPDCADVGAAGTAFDTSLLRVRLLRLCPPRPQSRRLCRQRVDEGDGEIEPLPQSLFVARWGIDEDVALHRAARHLHTFCVRPRQGPCVLVFADADEKTALRSSGDHIAVQHEAQPAEHSDFAHRAGPGENGPNALSEIFIES